MGLSESPPCSDATRRTLPLTWSYVDFIASFIFIRPFLQDPWNANISSFLNHIIDELLRDGGLDINHPSREDLLHMLCHHVFEMNHWKRNTWWFTKTLNLGSDFSRQTETSKFNVTLASVLLGRRTTIRDIDVPALVQRKSIVLGTLLEACVKSGQVDLVTSMLDIGVDLDEDFHSALEMAAECPNADMLGTMFTPKYVFACSGPRMKDCIKQAIENDRTKTTLYLLRKSNGSAYVNYHKGLLLKGACICGILPLSRS
ncbi:hypothetical protein K458DRAFT_154651 [Lentithecium fluviatile CBS 122367]|uniref:Ankyrin n=1 Tax=Lentithecium fluviatile CBS 122367 TaxID=1168545 RepID=A0A6G1JF93_9PLEO|nr:hypothetical protein K458DRAFT_154651 [Lentithecium fluviatile CBS 122367]